MKIKNIKDIDAKEDACGKLKELYNSKNLSLAYAKIKEDAIPHKHLEMEEVYYVLKGIAEIQIGDKTYKIKKGDIFSIPKGEYHYIKNIEKTIKLIVVTNPGFNPNDVLY